MRPHRAAATVVAVLATIAIVACGGGSSGYPTGSGGQNPPPGGQPPPAGTTATIMVENNFFDPPSTTVNAGTTVVWTWDTCRDDGYGGSSCVSHSVTFDGGAGGSPTQSTGAYSRQFNTAGTYQYRCGVHGVSMTGQVIVR